MLFLHFARQVLDQRAEDGIRGIDRERSRFHVHIETAAFVNKSLAEITKNDIRDWLRDMSNKRALGPGKPRTLSRQTAKRSFALLSAIFAAAVEREILEHNPCLGVKMKKRVDERDTQEKWAFLTLDEQRAISACEEIPIHDRLAIRFAFLTGLRQGEQFHLELQDLVLDGDNPHVFVRYASRSKKGEKLPPKSGKTRRVPLTAEAQSVCREWLAMLPSFAPENPYNLVFPTKTGKRRQQGKPLGRTGTLRGYYRAAGIKLRPYLHWHALRHTCASSLVSGVWGRRWTLEEVQVVMGHSSVMITQRYAHLCEDTIAQAARETTVTPVQPSLIVTAPEAASLTEEGPEQVRSWLRRTGAAAVKRLTGQFSSTTKEADRGIERSR